MLEKQENRITTDHPEIMLLKASFDEAVNFIFHHYEIPYARIKFEYQHDFIHSFQGTIDSALEKELELFERNLIQNNTPLLIEESEEVNRISFSNGFAGICLMHNPTIYTGTLSFVVPENCHLSATVLKAVEFLIKQLKINMAFFMQSNTLSHALSQKQTQINLFSENALELSYERFIYASMATSDALWDWDMLTNDIFVGESYSFLFGYHFENNKISGDFCEGLVHPDDRSAYERSIEKAIADGLSRWKYEYRYLKACGSYAFVSDKAMIIRDEKGQAVRMIGAMQDITQEKLLKDELLQSEERFKGAFNHSCLGMALVNNEDKWIEVNDRMCKILGYTREEFRQLTFIDITYEEDLAADLVFKSKMQSGEIPNFSMEKRYIHKDNSLVWVHLSVSPVKNGLGEIQHYVAQVIDISERKKMEEENRLLIEENNKNKALQLIEAKNWYRLLADNTIDLVCLHNLDVSFKYVSPSIHTLLGYDPEEMIGKYPVDFLHPDDVENFKKSIGTIIKGNKRFSQQVRLQHKNGNYSWFETNASIVFENEIPVGFQSSTRDITQRKKAEQIIEDTLVQERQLNELRTNLVSTISHEFRTPMTTIRSSAELIAMYIKKNELVQNPQIEKRVETITSEIDRIVELMDAVLTISKDDAGKTNFNPVVCNLNDICLDVIETNFSDQKDQRIVEVNFEAQDAEIYADINLIKYSLFNVLSNAFKYSEGAGNVKLNILLLDAYVAIEVIDNGIGIPLEDQSKLFNTFYRASNSNGIQGTGLGLYIIKTFAKKNSGKVHLESQLGKGTKVTLTFPRLKKDAYDENITN